MFNFSQFFRITDNAFFILKEKKSPLDSKEMKPVNLKGNQY